MLMLLLSVLFHLQNRVSVFEILIFSQDWENFHYVSEINHIFLRNSDNSLLYPKQNKLKEIWDTVL